MTDPRLFSKCDGFATAELTISAGTSLSNDIGMFNLSPVGLIVPAAWTAAPITFAVTHIDSATYRVLKQEAGEYALYSVAADDYIAISPCAFAGVSFLKVRSGTSSSPVNQAAARTLTLVMRHLNK